MMYRGYICKMFGRDINVIFECLVGIVNEWEIILVWDDKNLNLSYVFY